MGGMACYTATLIVRCYDYMKPRLLNSALIDPVADIPHHEDDTCANAHSRFTYGDIGQAAYGRFGAWFVTVQMHATLILVGTIYHLLAASNLHTLINPNVTSDETLSPNACVLIVAGILWFHVFLKTLSEVALVSYLNIAVNAALLMTVLVQSYKHPPTHPPTHRWLVTDDTLSLGEAFASFGAPAIVVSGRFSVGS